MARGIFEPVNKSNIGDDEFGHMYEALDRLVNAMEETVRVAGKIGHGEFDASYQPLSQEDKLGASLIEMKDRLKAYQINEQHLKRENQRSLISGEEKERSRLSKELHDGLGPLLTLLRIKLEAISIDGMERKELLVMLDNTIREMRRISNNLMPSVLMDFGAGEAIRNMVNQLTAEGLDVKYQYDANTEVKIADNIQIALYRVAQEAINNVIKHSGATVLNMSITEFEDRVSLFVKDNGEGFDVKSAKSGNGIRNMRERVNVEKGIFEIESGVNGTIIEVEIPLNE